MKKKLFIIAILFSIFSFISLKALSSKSASNINKPIVNIVEEQKIVKNNIQKIIDNNVYLANNNTYFINENITIEGKIKNNIYNKDSIIFTIKESDGTIICKYNQTLKDKQLIDKLPITINDMVVYNEQLIVVGEERNDACIYTYTIDGTDVYKRQDMKRKTLYLMIALILISSMLTSCKKKKYTITYENGKMCIRDRYYGL